MAHEGGPNIFKGYLVMDLGQVRTSGYAGNILPVTPTYDLRTYMPEVSNRR